VPDERVHRRLSAIIAADVVGYSRMMGRDEAGTLARLKALRAEFLHPKVAEYGGRIVKTTGDGALIEFPSAVYAVSHAVDVQLGMAERNKNLPSDRQIQLRFGINVGDVIIDEEDIYGDGVNVAARLEALAQPGGICISARVYEYIGDRLDVAFDDLGEQTVKNIAEPVHVYRIRLAESAGPIVGDSLESLPLPNKPSIAVLPFVNMSGDSEQEYFADGITEDLITALSRIRWFFVIARNSCFAYKGQSLDIRDVARKLGVAYVLEGSVRRAGNRVRITAQLIDGRSGNHVWAQRYDREMEDIFAVQDEITATLAGAIEPELGKAERERARAKRPDELRAWDLCQRGLWHTYKRTREDLVEAQRLFRKA
jgi:adenylate cyclase